MKALLAAGLMAGLSGLASAQPPPRSGRFDPDTNHDGYLSRAEALAAADARFERLDRNRDGKLTRDELAGPGPGAPPPNAGHAPRFAHARAVRAETLFAEYDANHDGALEIGEWRAQALARFNAADGNRDGRVKLPERGAAGERGAWGRGDDRGGPDQGPPPR